MAILPVLFLCTFAAQNPAPVSSRSPRDAAWVSARIQKWQPTERERRWERIGWATDIREAERLASKSNRPVFLFTHDGHLAVGRC